MAGNGAWCPPLIPRKESEMARQAKSGQPTYSAEKVRQGEIILRKPWERVVFLAGLVGAFVLALVVIFFHH